MKKAMTGIMLVIMAIGIVSLIPSFVNADDVSIKAGEWVRMNGFIQEWNMTNGTTAATYGWITANAAIVNNNGTTHEWAIVHAIWSDIMHGIHPLGSVNVTAPTVIGPNVSYTFDFFIAKLVNLTELDFNSTVTGHTLYLVGIWNVSEITETINFTWSETVKQTTITWNEQPVATNANGTLVADWGGPFVVGTFALTIDGVGTLAGHAWESAIWFHELNICDFGETGTVGITDLVKVGKHYGEVPGFANYDPTLDLDGNGRIDMGDLTTIAANIQG